jgi:SAM-dependent MidA family methyltransferase
VAFSVVVEAALYDPDHGFYAGATRVGRRGDFITSPEVGPLFGAVLARALDSWWEGWGRPDPYVVVEHGAGAGTLALSIQSAEPVCLGALRYVGVDRGHPAPDARSHVVLANELLDNLPFDLAERRGGRWHEVLVGIDADRSLVEVAGPPLDIDPAPDAPDGARIPLARAAADWLATVIDSGPRRMVVFDYVSTTAAMAARPPTDWLRTYRRHQRGGDPLHDLGHQDITADVAVDQLVAVRPPDRVTTQAEFLAEHGIDELVAEARRTWTERAHIGDLAAVAARSRVGEAAALTDPAGLGGFGVLEWIDPAPPPASGRRG